MTPTDINAFLHSHDPFKKIPLGELKRLSGQSQILQFNKGEYIFSEGDDADFVWVLKEGRLDIYKYSSDGKPRVIETIKPGELFGTLCRLGGKGRTYPCTSRSATTSTAIRIPETIFMDLFHRYPSFVTGVCMLCSTRLNQLQNLSCVSQETVEVRIAKVIIDLNERMGPVMSVTKREIAERATTTVETTIRTMKGFENKQWILSGRGKLKLQDKKSLEKIVNQI